MYKYVKISIVIVCLIATMIGVTRTPTQAITTNWQGVGAVASTVTNTCVVGSDIYVAGRFSDVGIASTNKIARYSTATKQWESVGGGVDTGTSINALACTSTTVYAGGVFTSIGSVAVNNLAAYTIASDTWADVGTGVTGGVTPVRALLYIEPDLYVGGHLTSANSGALTVNGLAVYDTNASTWSDPGATITNGQYVMSLAESGNNVVVGGDFPSLAGLANTANIGIYTPSTSTWSSIGGLDWHVSMLATSGSSIYALTGDKPTVNGTLYSNNLAHYNTNTSTWSDPGVGMDFPAHATTAVGSQIYIATWDMNFETNVYQQTAGSNTFKVAGRVCIDGRPFSIALVKSSIFLGGGFAGYYPYVAATDSCDMATYTSFNSFFITGKAATVSRRPAVTAPTTSVPTYTEAPSYVVGTDEGFPYSSSGELRTEKVTSTYEDWNVHGISPYQVLTDTVSISLTQKYFADIPQWSLNDAPLASTLGTRSIRDSNNRAGYRFRGAVSFPETGYELSGYLRDFLERNGGIEQLGFPIGEPYVVIDPETQLAVIMQYTERGRIEQPLSADGSYLTPRLGLIGVEYLANQTPITPAAYPVEDPNVPTVQYFPQTRHTIQGVFADYFEANGEVETNGYPITEPFIEKYPDYPYHVTVQYFERVRLEYHGDINDPLYGQITLGRLSIDLFQRQP